MAYIGACPDMCPEKERQARYTLKSMSIFERDKYNQPNVCAMVKEYRRSGADQEEPSPLDLRTPKALELTLDYLVLNIMDDSRSTTQELAGEWYDFLWDRLRAIRKDITQQNICDQASAILVERCARFHVHTCYAMNRIKDFDLDMNKRNLNDCLQMVRQMYHDLKVSTGTICAGELEFQKYDILLHLNEDHLSSTLLMKMSDYRSSAEMKFISQIFNAYTNNDYYKFFQSMERADYMTSCVLSLYANKMRIIGLKTIINACAPRQATLYPSDLITRSLGFDDDEDLKSFASLFGIGIQEKDAKVYLVLTKELLQILRNYESVLPPFKSKRLVADKMQGLSVGQLVYGNAELPKHLIAHQYHPSMDFDEEIRIGSGENVAEEEEEDEYYDEDGENEDEEEYDEEKDEVEEEEEVGQYYENDQCDDEEEEDEDENDEGVVENETMDRTETEFKDEFKNNIKGENVKIDMNVNINANLDTVENEYVNEIEKDIVIEDDNLFNNDNLINTNNVVETDEAVGSDHIVGKNIVAENLENVIEEENPGESPPSPTTPPSLPNPKLSQIARDMPAGYFKVRSLSSKLPILQLQLPDQDKTVSIKRSIAEPMQRKKLKTIVTGIEEEKNLNQVYLKQIKIFTL